MITKSLEILRENNTCKSKIGQFDINIIFESSHKNVLGFQITMHDVVLMTILHSMHKNQE